MAYNEQDRKTRGRTSISGTKMSQAGASGRATRPNTKNSRMTQVSRPQGPGGTMHRGDRRDMHKTYTGNQRHSARGATGRPDVSTRKD